MSKENKHILFLNNRYPAKYFDFYLKLLVGRARIAVDGGLRFFIRNKIKPDLLIGDLDSVPRLSKRYLSNIKTIIHPVEKDKTDSELALDYALEHRAEDIIICGALSENQIDHTLGNIFLLNLIRDYSMKAKRKVDAKIISPHSEIFLLSDSGIKINGKKGDVISILPLSVCNSVEFEGLSYVPPNEKPKFGSSRTLRNRMLRKKCSVSCVGEAIIVPLFDSAQLSKKYIIPTTYS